MLQPGCSDLVLDLERFLLNVDGDRELALEVAQMFLEDAPREVQELQGALAAGDAGEMEKVAHRIRGSLNSLAAGPASDAAFEMERLGRTGQLDRARAVLQALEIELDRLRAELVNLNW